VASEYLGKGSSVLIEGRLKLDTWETDGQKRSKLKVVGERMQMLGARASRDQRPETRDESELSRPSLSMVDDSGSAPASGPPIPDDDIPF
jgi:single-strand DNA-binding protein